MSLLLAHPVIEIPQSISTIPFEQLEELNPQSVRGALNYTSGVLSGIETTSRYDSIFLRDFGGFGTATNVVDFLDGLKLPHGQAFALPSVDSFLLERIDVLKGPSALLYSQTSPGGLVNQMSCLPTDLPYHEARIRRRKPWTHPGRLHRPGANRRRGDSAVQPDRIWTLFRHPVRGCRGEPRGPGADPDFFFGGELRIFAVLFFAPDFSSVGCAVSRKAGAGALQRRPQLALFAVLAIAGVLTGLTILWHVVLIS